MNLFRSAVVSSFIDAVFVSEASDCSKKVVGSTTVAYFCIMRSASQSDSMRCFDGMRPFKF